MIQQAAPKLSKVSKLDGIPSWSLEAVKTCPGSIAADTQELVPACQGCYARGGHYRYRNVRAAREHNRIDWRRPGWVQAMVAAIRIYRYFRWFDSGDVYHPLLARRIFQVIQHTPETRHWLPTRSHKLPRIDAILREIDALPNAVVRRSSDAIDGSFIPGLHGSTIVPEQAAAPTGTTACRAHYHPAGNCNGCRACWDKQIPVIAYIAHGRRMQPLVASR